jgi:hypothetical protein
LNAVPGQDKAYNVVVGTALAATLLSKEIIPYTAEMAYALPFVMTIALAYKHVGPAISNMASGVIKVRLRAFLQINLRQGRGKDLERRQDQGRVQLGEGNPKHYRLWHLGLGRRDGCAL